MVELLANGGWQHSRVVPYGGESWITESWLPLVRNLIVSQTPGVSLSLFGTQIIKSSIRAKQYSSENAVIELQRAAISLLGDFPESQNLGIELLYLGSGHRWKVIGSQIAFGQFFGGTLAEEMFEIVSTGPLLVEESQFSHGVRDALKTAGVRVVQVEVAQPLPNMQAILCITSGSLKFAFESHRVQSILRELKSLIELALLIDWTRPHPKKPTRQHTTDIDPFSVEG